MSDEAIIEAAAKSLQTILEMVSLGLTDTRRLAKVLLAAVTPLIEAAALEEAAQVVRDYDTTGLTVYELQCGIAAALKEQP